jgi:hypothetical protein
VRDRAGAARPPAAGDADDWLGGAIVDAAHRAADKAAEDGDAEPPFVPDAGPPPYGAAPPLAAGRASPQQVWTMIADVIPAELMDE